LLNSSPRKLVSIMAHESSLPQWDVLAAELRAFRDQQKQTWGDVDSALIGRYLAGEASAEDRRRVEAAFDEHPDLRVLTELVSDVLNEFEPLTATPPVPPPVQQSEATRPRLLPFTGQPKLRRSFLTRVRRYGALAAAACLLLALGVGLGGQSLPPSDTTAGRGWEEARAERVHGKNEELVTSRDMHPSLVRSARTPGGFAGSPMALKADSAPAHALAGVNDAGNVLAEQSRRDLNQRIQTLCRKHHFYFVAETVASLPDDRKHSCPVAKDVKQDQTVAQWGELRRRQVGAENGLYLLICQDPPAVHIALGQDARTRVRPQMTEQLNRWLHIHLRDKDKGLEKAVNLVEHELSRSR